MPSNLDQWSNNSTGPFKDNPTGAIGADDMRAFAAAISADIDVVDAAKERKTSFNVMDYGAVGNGVADDSVAIRATLAAAAVVNGTTVIPEGTYKVSKDGSNAWCLTLPANARITGSGTIKMADSQSSAVRPIHIAAVNVSIDGVTINGNSSGQSVDEQKHGIVTTATASIVKIRNVLVQNCRGDGILIEGTSGVFLVNITTRSCERNGITLYAYNGEVTSNVLISGCDLECVYQAIDFEPEGTGDIYDIRIVGNRIATTTDSYGLAIGGSAIAHPVRQVLVQGNDVVGSVFLIFGVDIIVESNIIDGTISSSFYAVHTQDYSERVIISGNTIKAASNKIGLYVVSSTTTPKHFVVAKNIVKTSGTDGLGMRVSGTGPISVEGNQFFGVNGYAGIIVQASFDMPSVQVVNNVFDGFANGIETAPYSTNNIEKMVVTGNTVDNTGGTPTMTRGISIAGAAAQYLNAHVFGNVVDPGYAVPIDLWSTTVRTGGDYAPSFSCTGTPEGAIIAPIGSTAMRRDGGAGTSFYVKESGTGNTGWVAK
jgi:hypothetical protein